LLDSAPHMRDGAVRVGFALETEDGVANARKKLEGKSLDLIVLNNALEPGAGIGGDTNHVTILARDGNVEEIPMMLKREVADIVLDRVAARLREG
ncbi:MAG: phosphopantothenoylcysteine decarboxylase, partial [Gemmatimonadaceae bacterium]